MLCMIFLFAAMTAAAKLHQPRMPVIFLRRLDILCVCDGLFHQFLLGIQRRQAVVNAFHSTLPDPCGGP